MMPMAPAVGLLELKLRTGLCAQEHSQLGYDNGQQHIDGPCCLQASRSDARHLT